MTGTLKGNEIEAFDVVMNVVKPRSTNEFGFETEFEAAKLGPARRAPTFTTDGKDEMRL